MCASPEISQTVQNFLQPVLLFRSGDREAKYALRGDCDFLFTGSSSKTGPGSCAHSGANRCAFTAAGQGPDQSSCSCSTADLGNVAFSMALAFAAYTRAINPLTVDGDQSQRELSWFVQASAAVHVSHFSFDWIARVGHGLTVMSNVTGQRPAPALLFVGSSRT